MLAECTFVGLGIVILNFVFEILILRNKIVKLFMLEIVANTMKTTSKSTTSRYQQCNKISEKKLRMLKKINWKAKKTKRRRTVAKMRDIIFEPKIVFLPEKNNLMQRRIEEVTFKEEKKNLEVFNFAPKIVS